MRLFWEREWRSDLFPCVSTRIYSDGDDDEDASFGTGQDRILPTLQVVPTTSTHPQAPSQDGEALAS